MTNPAKIPPTLVEAVRGKVIYVLILVVMVQTIYPITAGGSTLSLLVYQVLYAALMFAGTIVVRENPAYVRLLVVLGILWLIGGVTYALNPDALWAGLLAYMVIVPFQVMVARVLLEYIFTTPTVNRDVIYAAVAVYFLLGAIFVPVYGIIESVTYAQTGLHAFSDSLVGANQIFPWQHFIYYSYSTLTTLGYGDVLPVTMMARAAASVEAIIGVLYITIIMARLVGLYAAHDVEAERDSKKE